MKKQAIVATLLLVTPSVAAALGIQEYYRLSWIGWVSLALLILAGAFLLYRISKISAGNWRVVKTMSLMIVVAILFVGAWYLAFDPSFEKHRQLPLLYQPYYKDIFTPCVEICDPEFKRLYGEECQCIPERI